MAQFDIENIFTRKDFDEFMKAVQNRENYEFVYGKEGTYLPHPTTGVYFKVDGRKCDNSVWKDNYLYGIDCWRGNGGVGMPIDPVDKIVTYDELVDLIYAGIGLKPPKSRQMSFFDMEM